MPVLPAQGDRRGCRQQHDRVKLQVESMGEALVVIGASNGWGPYPLTSQQADLVLDELTNEMGRIEADSTILRRRSESGAEKGDCSA